MEVLLLMAQATQQPAKPPVHILTAQQITQSYCSNYGGRPHVSKNGEFIYCGLTEEQYQQVQKDFNNKRFVLGRYSGA